MSKKVLTLTLATCICVFTTAQQRIGIIGLDTSHSIAFTKLVNGDGPSKGQFEVVAAYPYGSRVIESAYSRIPKYTEEARALGVVITSSIAELLGMVDCVLLETNDGNLHLEQALEVFKAGKKIYIDKPVGATLAQAMAIYDLAERYGVTFFSSSAVRFSAMNQRIRAGEFGRILGADCYSPHHPEPTHPDFGYYGLHGVEELFTVMGTGCEQVSRVHTESGDVVTGKWADGRIGTFRAIIKGPYVYGGTAFIEKEAIPTGGYTGYQPLVDQILKFFETGVCPVDKDETLEIFAFMEASNLSLERGGRPVTLDEVRKKARKESRKLLASCSEGTGRRLRRMVVIAPGHFHASLTQKKALPEVNDTVWVYSPSGPELQEYLSTVASYATRHDDPVRWVECVYEGDDFLSAIPKAAPGDFVVLAGKNNNKARYILESVRKGYNVLSDKPMAISKEDFILLEEAYKEAGSHGLVIFEMMTERYDLVNRVAEALVLDSVFFGQVQGVSMSSLHHFYKEVSGKPLRRPAWYYDTHQQGEGIADVTTHLIDLAFRVCSPGNAVRSSDIQLDSARHWTTPISLEQFAASTLESSFPSFLEEYVSDGKLEVCSNGSMSFRVRGIPVHIDVRWEYAAPPGGGDTSCSLFEGSRANVSVIQDETTGFGRLLIIQADPSAAKEAVKRLNQTFPAVSLSVRKDGSFLMDLSRERQSSHEEHFSQVAGKFLGYLDGEPLPVGEDITTLTKYKLTTDAISLASHE